MGGQVLGGGVVVLVAVLLWLVYLLPSWHGRHQYNAAERNAVRLNQALRVLAETSETPAEVHLELNARTALAQQRLARRAQADREHIELARTRAELTVERERARAAAESARADAAVARAEAAARRDRARAEAAAAHAMPAARRARARRRARLITTIVGALGLALAGWGGVVVVLSGSQLALWSGVVVSVVSALLLRQMAAVGRRVDRGVAAFAVARPVADMQDVSLASDRTTWTPRELPRPLTVSAGSRAAAVLDAAAAHEALRQAAVEESARELAERSAPAAMDAVRAARAAEAELRRGAGDDEIEAHVRRLLERRAAV